MTLIGLHRLFRAPISLTMGESAALNTVTNGSIPQGVNGIQT